MDFLAQNLKHGKQKYANKNPILKAAFKLNRMMMKRRYCSRQHIVLRLSMEKRNCQSPAMAKRNSGQIRQKFAGKSQQKLLNIGKKNAGRKFNVMIGAPGATTQKRLALTGKKKKGSDFAGKTKIVF